MQPIWKNARNLRNNATDEQKLWRHLRNRQLAGVKFRWQYPIAGHVADFASPEQRLVIELDGGQHVDRREQDEARTRKLTCNGYRVLRFWNDDVLLRTEDVVDEILRVLTQPLPNPPGPQAQPAGVHRCARQCLASAPLHPLPSQGME